MEMTKKEFIRKYTSAIRKGNAAIFAGAGLSRASGFVDWKNLLRPLAERINLDVDKESDLLAVAQYVRNEAYNRTSINQEIIEAFTESTYTNKNIDIISRLPIYTYWTTNYDVLIEEGLEKANRRADVKERTSQLPHTLKDRDAIVYKMHGDYRTPADAVLTKDDYVLYDKNRPLFRTVLQGDLISKTFLFVGFSFEDPNISFILDQITGAMGENVPEHYCIFRKVQKSDYSLSEEFEYALGKQDLRIKDLARRGIRTVFVDDYDEITDVLSEIESSIKRNNVFISGSADDYNGWSDDDLEKLVSGLAQKLIKNNFKITSGFGKGIGSLIVNGALTEIYQSKYKHTDEHLCLRPFPYRIKDANERKNRYTQYRKDTISDTGIAIFMFGNKKDSLGNVIDADGCWEEYQFAKDNGDLIIPLASTGSVAKRILDKIKANPDDFKYLDAYIDVLETEKDPNKIIETVLKIVETERF